MVKRNFVLGEDWIYYKLYTGTKTADKVLVEAIKPAIDYLLDAKQIDKWFFIRYTDPDFHIRLRLHCTHVNNTGNIVQTIYKHIEKFVDQELIWKVQTDTYQREIERYGAHTMELSEQLFFYDSELILNVLPFFKSPDSENQRWLFALKVTDSLLNCFKYKPENKLYLFQGLKVGFGNEFGINHFLKNQLDVKFRKERTTIEQTLIANSGLSVNLLEKIEEYNKLVIKTVNKILQYHTNNQLGMNLDVLLSSYIHMTMNRTFSSKQRLHELVLYDFLFRFYNSEVAKAKYKNQDILLT